jgi:hypothetical protein
MKKPDFEKFTEEVNKMQVVPPVSIEISPLRVLAMITLIQAGIQQKPEIADDQWAKIGIATVQQLQEVLFNQYPETCKVLEFCWNPGAYLITRETIAAMMQDIESRRRSEKNKTTEIISSDGDGDAGCAETLSQKISRKILESQGYADM